MSDDLKFRCNQRLIVIQICDIAGNSNVLSGHIELNQNDQVTRDSTSNLLNHQIISYHYNSTCKTISCAVLPHKQSSCPCRKIRMH